jgi:hypothetical protein
MKPTLMCVGMLLLPSVGQDVTIRYVPKTIDPGFSTRTSLCPGTPYDGGVFRRNDARHTLAQLLGPITAIDVPSSVREKATSKTSNAPLRNCSKSDLEQRIGTLPGLR